MWGHTAWAGRTLAAPPRPRCPWPARHATLLPVCPPPQPELLELAFPLFIHCYLNSDDASAKFFEVYRLDHECRHRTMLEEVAAYKDRAALKDNPVRGRAHCAVYVVNVSNGASVGGGVGAWGRCPAQRGCHFTACAPFG